MRWFISLKQKAKRIKKEVITLSLAVKDPRTPLIAKIMIALTISYALSPIDLIPDFIPVLGYLDDLILLPILIIISLKLIPKDVLDDCRNRVDKAFNPDKKTGIVMAGVIVLLWISLLVLVICRIVSKSPVSG